MNGKNVDDVRRGTVRRKNLLPAHFFRKQIPRF